MDQLRLLVSLRLRSWGFRPGILARDEDGQEIEIMSYPYPGDDGSYAVNGRSRPGDPGSLRRYRIHPMALDLLQLAEDANRAVRRGTNGQAVA